MKLDASTEDEMNVSEIGIVLLAIAGFVAGYVGWFYAVVFAGVLARGVERNFLMGRKVRRSTWFRAVNWLVCQIFLILMMFCVLHSLLLMLAGTEPAAGSWGVLFVSSLGGLFAGGLLSRLERFLARKSSPRLRRKAERGPGNSPEHR